MNKLFDFENPFFRPVWRRVVLVAVCLLWGLFEYSNGHQEWSAVFVFLGLFAAWRFVVIDYSDSADNSDD